MKQKLFTQKPSRVTTLFNLIFGDKNRRVWNFVGLSIVVFNTVIALSCLTGCSTDVDPAKTSAEKVLTSTRYLPVEVENLRVTQEKISNIYTAIDSLGLFVARQQNPELHSFYVELVSNMEISLNRLKQQESESKTNIQAYTFYINHYGGGKQEVELKQAE